jgi:hypothetical protein
MQQRLTIELGEQRCRFTKFNRKINSSRINSVGLTSVSLVERRSELLIKNLHIINIT